MSKLNSKPKVAVVGAGAIGSVIGGLLANGGEDVTLIGRKAHVEAIQEKGLIIQGVEGDLIIHLKAAEALNFKPDLLLLAVKTQDVETTCRSIMDYGGESTIVTLQNGVRSDEIVSSFVPRNNIISGVVMFNAQYLNPGRVTYARSKALIIGEAFGENGQRVKEVRALLNRAIQTEISIDIQGAHWTKLLVNNISNGLEAMSGMTISECMKYRGLRRIGTHILKEGYRIIKQAGFHLAALPGVPAIELNLIIHLPVPVSAWILNLSMGDLKTVSSTLQSLRRGRLTEIDYLNGEIVRLGVQSGNATPYNSKVVEIVKMVEESNHFFSPDDLVRRFSGN